MTTALKKEKPNKKEITFNRTAQGFRERERKKKIKEEERIITKPFIMQIADQGTPLTHL